MAYMHKASTAKILNPWGLQMEVWGKKSNDIREFSGGNENWALASKTAKACPLFRPDDEDEQVSDDFRSCYNCLYRRWTAESFMCMKMNI
jgi:hypothetical protein